MGLCYGVGMEILSAFSIYSNLHGFLYCYLRYDYRAKWVRSGQCPCRVEVERRRFVRRYAGQTCNTTRYFCGLDSLSFGHREMCELWKYGTFFYFFSQENIKFIFNKIFSKIKKKLRIWGIPYELGFRIFKGVFDIIFQFVFS